MAYLRCARDWGNPVRIVCGLAGMRTGHFPDTDEKRCAGIYLRYSCKIVVRNINVV